MRVSVGFVCAAVAVSLVTAAVAQPRDPRQWGFDERYYREDDDPWQEEGSTKLCSVYVPNNWRDTIPVPASWKWNDCRDYAASVGASHIHLICIFDRGSPKISMGGPGGPPERNCGWGRRR